MTPVSSPDILPQRCINIVSCFNYFIMIMPHRKTLEAVLSLRILKVGALITRLITHTLVSAICRLSFALRQPVSGLHARRSNSVHSFWRGGGGGCGSWCPCCVRVEISSALGGNNRWTGSAGCAKRTQQTIRGKIFTGRGSNCKRLAV